MNKFFVCSVAGAALVLTGCQSEVMDRRSYVPAPKQETAVENLEKAPEAKAPEAKPEAAPVPVPVEPPAFQPMTGVKSSGGVDSAPRSKVVKAGKGQSAALAGGTYVVRSGDTLGKIARKCNISLSALMEANHLDQNSARKIRVGQKLVLPGKGAQNSGKKAVAAKTGKKGSAAAVSSAAAAADGFYVVKPGDNPYTICRKLKVRRSDLLKANNLSEEAARKLRVGQKLVIPGKTASAAADKAAAPAVPAEAAPAAPEIPAEAPSVPTEAAPTAPTAAAPAEAAPAAAPAAAAPAAEEAAANLGNYEMTVVEDQQIKAADFAARHGISVEELRKLNPGMKDEVFTSGQMLFVPKK